MNRQQILDYLTRVSNDQIAVNVAIHVIVLVAVLTVVFTRRAAVRRVVVGGTVLTLLVSVLATALVNGNPFHLVAFALLSGVAGYELLANGQGHAVPRWSGTTVVSAGLIITGLWYPEFVEASPAALMLLSPLGRVPCPTLLVVLGLLGLVRQHVSRPYYAVVASVGLLFGIIGTVVLGVYLDAALLLAALHGFWNIHRLSRTASSSARAGSDLRVAA